MCRRMLGSHELYALKVFKRAATVARNGHFVQLEGEASLAARGAGGAAHPIPIIVKYSKRVLLPCAYVLRENDHVCLAPRVAFVRFIISLALHAVAWIQR